MYTALFTWPSIHRAPIHRCLSQSSRRRGGGGSCGGGRRARSSSPNPRTKPRAFLIATIIVSSLTWSNLKLNLSLKPLNLFCCESQWPPHLSNVWKSTSTIRRGQGDAPALLHEDATGWIRTMGRWGSGRAPHGPQPTRSTEQLRGRDRPKRHRRRAAGFRDELHGAVLQLLPARGGRMLQQGHPPSPVRGGSAAPLPPSSAPLPAPATAASPRAVP